MKKTLYLFLSLLLCFALFACTQEPSTTPNEVETATPEVTPNEVETATPEVTPNEMGTVTPNEPEVVTPNEPETPNEPDKNVVMLPEADENTKYITIDFPEDFPEEPYTQPNLVSPEEFEWGEYVPFVEFDGWMFKQHLYEYDYGVITSNTKSLDDSKNIYNKLNEKYLTESEIVNGIYCAENEYTVTDKEHYGERYIDFLFKSKIIYISEEADEIGVLRYICNEADGSDHLIDRDWTEIYNIYKNGSVIRSLENKKAPIFGSGGYVNEGTHNFLHPEIGLTSDPERSIIFINDDICIYREWASNTDEYLITIYSVPKKKTIAILTAPQEPYSGFKAEQCIDSRYILFTVYRGVYDEELGFPTHYYYNTYIYDIQTSNFDLLEKYTLNPCISPDLKYLCYTSDFSEAYGFGTGGLMPRGFYIKNLENGETVFYEYDGFWLFGVMSWVNEEKLMELIGE